MCTGRTRDTQKHCLCYGWRHLCSLWYSRTPLSGCSWCHTSTWYYQNKHCYQITSEKQASTRKFLTFERICRLKFLVNPNLKYSPPSERLDTSDPRLSPPFPEGRGDSCSSRDHIFRRELSFQRPATTSEGGRQQGMPPAHRS